MLIVEKFFAFGQNYFTFSVTRGIKEKSFRTKNFHAFNISIFRASLIRPKTVFHRTTRKQLHGVDLILGLCCYRFHRGRLNFTIVKWVRLVCGLGWCQVEASRAHLNWLYTQNLSYVLLCFLKIFSSLSSCLSEACLIASLFYDPYTWSTKYR